jgi:nucleoside-diphosphate-sugar epimerase
MNILVVGGAGYVGGALTDELLERQYSVRVYDSLLYEEAYRKPVDFVYGDIRDEEKLVSHLKWADVVIWLAALVGDGACALDPEMSVELNQDQVRWFAQNFDGRIVFLSTCSVYGAQDGVLDENDPVNPLSVYAATKLAAEDYLKDKNAIIFRLGTLFGLGDLFSRIRLDLIVNILTVRAATQGEITVFGGDQFRPLLHVRDVGIAIADNLEKGQVGVYNLNRQNVRIVDLAYQVRNHFPDVVIHRTEMKFEDARNYQVSSEKARRELHFSPSHTIDEGIDEIKRLIENGRIKDLNNPRYANQSYLGKQEAHLPSYPAE